MMDLFTNLLFLLAVALFVGIATLVKMLLSPERGLERRSHGDRRCTALPPAMPFYDKHSELVLEDRRRCMEDRRKRTFVITTEHRRA